MTNTYWAQWKMLRPRDVLLYHMCISPMGNHVMLPQEYRDAIVRQLHDAPVNKPLCLVRELFYWVGGTHDVNAASVSCFGLVTDFYYNVGAPM